MLNIILSIFGFGFFLKIIVPSIFIGIIIYIISKYSGMEQGTIMDFLSNGMKNFVDYLASCFEYIKDLF